MGIGDRFRELQDLVAVHQYFCALLQQTLGYPLLIPEIIAGLQPEAKADDELRRWLGLLDLAITPQMLRYGLSDANPQVPSALLRYYVRKYSAHRMDRDKVDLMATSLYREWRKGRAAQPAEIVDPFIRPDFARVPEFAGRLYAILCDVRIADLPEEHRQLLREFPFMLQEVEEIRAFDQLIDSGLIRRVRHIKETFGRSIYHPYVLAAAAEYNVIVGTKFDELFRETVRDVRAFAVAAEQAGGSPLSRVNDEITYNQLSEVEEAILAEEYEGAHPKFQDVSRLTKAIKGRKRKTPVNSVSGAGRGGGMKELAEQARHTQEASLTRGVANSIRDFVRAADPDSSLNVPLSKGNFILSPAERDAFAASYANEDSFRGKYVTILVEIVATTARLREEMASAKEKVGSVYLWRPHADHLAYLVNAAQQLQEKGAEVKSLAQGRGLQGKISALNASLEKLEMTRQRVTAFLKTAAEDNVRTS